MGEVVINMQLLNTKVYMERESGEAAAKQFQLDRLINVFDKIIVIFPEDTFSVTNSFFTAMFGPYMLQAGSKEEFLKQFVFKAPYMVEIDINDMIETYMLLNTTCSDHVKSKIKWLVKLKQWILSFF